jgi:hypothetical protein
MFFCGIQKSFTDKVTACFLGFRSDETLLPEHKVTLPGQDTWPPPQRPISMDHTWDEIKRHTIIMDVYLKYIYYLLLLSGCFYLIIRYKQL